VIACAFVLSTTNEAVSRVGYDSNFGNAQLETFADVADLAAAVGFRPRTRIKCGIRRFIAWYRDYWKASNR
jgi:nucleoside-diphosphate-sugar epimerase